MAGGGGNDRNGIYDVNMTPLIDVSLVLVVILDDRVLQLGQLLGDGAPLGVEDPGHLRGLGLSIAAKTRRRVSHTYVVPSTARAKFGRPLP